MSQEIVRCPYCVQDGDFRPMFRRSNDSFVCAGCGHTSSPADPHLKCVCGRCHQMNRVANRISRDRPDLPTAANP